MGFHPDLFTDEISQEDLLCKSCFKVLDNPIALPCSHLVCRRCLFTKKDKQILHKCPYDLCSKRIQDSYSFYQKRNSKCQEDSGEEIKVPSWIKIQLNSLTLKCPKLCNCLVKMNELQRHLSDFCAKTILPCPNAKCPKRLQRGFLVKHLVECQFRQVQCEVCCKSMPYSDLAQHELKTRCHDLAIKYTRKESMRKCNNDIINHYRLLREDTLETIKQFRKLELDHWAQRGIPGFARKESLPQLPFKNTKNKTYKCVNCSKQYRQDQNNEMACVWHGGPIVKIFGGLCTACGKPSHQTGCVISYHFASNNSVSRTHAISKTVNEANKAITAS